MSPIRFCCWGVMRATCTLFIENRLVHVVHLNLGNELLDDNHHRRHDCHLYNTDWRKLREEKNTHQKLHIQMQKKICLVFFRLWECTKWNFIWKPKCPTMSIRFTQNKGEKKAKIFVVEKVMVSHTFYWKILFLKSKLTKNNKFLAHILITVLLSEKWEETEENVLDFVLCSILLSTLFLFLLKCYV